MPSATPTATTIYLGGGCFWCTEAIFTRLQGVQAVCSGYANGHTQYPSYTQVCTGSTGHAEVLQVHYDPTVLTLQTLLQVFFATHDPTTLNRQGHDVGTQYRSCILTTTAQQQATAQAVVTALNSSDNPWGAPVVTQVEPLQQFWPAEEDHHDYFARNPQQGYCVAVVAPKVDRLQSLFPTLCKP